MACGGGVGRAVVTAGVADGLGDDRAEFVELAVPERADQPLDRRHLLGCGLWNPGFLIRLFNERAVVDICGSVTNIYTDRKTLIILW